MTDLTESVEGVIIYFREDILTKQLDNHVFGVTSILGVVGSLVIQG